MGNRDAAIDLVRVAGIAAIVAGHVWESTFTWLAFYPWHVPVFFFLTGYLWKNPRPLSGEIEVRSKTLLKPYVFWFVILFAAFAIVLIRAGAITLPALLIPIYGGFFAGRPFTTFWFVFVLFAAAILYRLLQSIPQWARLIVLGVALIASILGGGLLARTPLAVGSAIPALLFIAAGHAARTHQPRIPAPGWVGFGLILAGAALVLSGVSAPVNIKQGDWGTPVVSVVVACGISWGLILVAQTLMRPVPARAHQIITSVALTGFTIVLVHPAVLWVLGADPQNGNVLIYAVAVLIPLLVGLVALRTPISQWATGIPKQAPQRVTMR